MTEKWFGPKRYGYGVVPINTKGVATLAGYLIAVGVVVFDVLLASFRNDPRSPVWTMMIVGGLTIILLLIARAKGPSSWRAQTSSENE